MSIAENLLRIKTTLHAGVKLIAVSKFKPVAAIQEAYDAGQRIFGENRVQEMAEKQPQLPADIEWHMIGHLQSNKVKYMAPFVTLIHGVDSLKLLEEIDKQAQKAGRVQDCLLQIYIAQEETKFGFNREEVLQLLDSQTFHNLKNIRICGLMGMATLTDDKDLIHREFKGLKNLHNELKQRFFAGHDSFNELSMGMSSDYEIAIEEGSTMLRIGTAIFGGR